MHTFSRTFSQFVAQLSCLQNSRREYISVQIMMKEDSRLTDRLGGKKLDINLRTYIIIFA
jgi:hypothetical protein